MKTAAHPQLLDTYPLVRSRDIDEASERIGRVFSPHRLELKSRGDRLDVRHNQVRLQDVSLNVLHYGAEVVIDPGERGDFYLVQLPLSGSARLHCGQEAVRVDTGVLSVLQPQSRSRMEWSGDCSMVLVQVPRHRVHASAGGRGAGAAPRFSLSYPRQSPAVGAWWQSVLDLTVNIDRFGAQWLQHPVACRAMEEFLVSAFSALLCENGGEGDPAPAGPAPGRDSLRCLQRAKDYIHAHLDRALGTAEIAAHACVSPRTLEAVFKRCGEPPPLAYARRCRLQAVHDVLCQARREGRPARVTDTAFAHGFLHMGRLAEQYRALFGCSPSDTARVH